MTPLNLHPFTPEKSGQIKKQLSSVVTSQAGAFSSSLSASHRVPARSESFPHSSTDKLIEPQILPLRHRPMSRRIKVAHVETVLPATLYNTSIAASRETQPLRPARV